jgi:two-component system sensor histidine kinase HydH
MKLGVPVPDPDQSLVARLAWITGLRLAFLTLLLVVIAIFYLGGELTRFPVSMRIVWLTIGAAFALAAIYAAVLRSGKNLRSLAYAQLFLDQITWTAIVYVSGGATSGATSFYAFTCLMAAILVGLRGAAVAAATGAAMYVTLCMAFVMHWITPPSDQLGVIYATRWSELSYPLLMNGLGVLVVALLAGYLAERLRMAGGALAEATLRADAAERLAVLGRIAAGLAHEIRNPLGSISGSIDMLRESPALSAEDKRLCDIVQAEASRLNNLVTDMLDLSKPRPPVAEAVDVARLAQEVVALAQRSERSGTGDVRVAYDGPTAPTLARCDGEQMRQVVWNLVRNAVQASAAGTVVTVRIVPNGREVVLSVDDQGPGIPEESKARLFDAFFTTRSHGVGIGLAVVKRIVDEHARMGARIEVESPASGGASFQVILRTDVTSLPAGKWSLPPRALG